MLQDVDSDGRDHLGDVAEVTFLTTSHATVLDFLTSESIKEGPLPEIKLTKPSVAMQMAKVFLGYLHSLFEILLKSRAEMIEESLGEYLFARLCAEFWDDFYRKAMEHDDETSSMELLNEMAIRLFDSKSELLMAVRLCDPNDESNRVNHSFSVGDLESPLYYAVVYGMPDIVEHYINEGAEIDYTVSRGYGTPLVAAAVLGRYNVASLLLEKGADPTAGGK